MRAPSILLRLGPSPYPPKLSYATLRDGRVSGHIAALTDDEAIDKARASDDSELVAEPALGDAAARKRVPTRALTAIERTMKAALATGLLAPEHYGNAPDLYAMLDLFEAASVFARAIAEDTRPEWFIGATATGTIEDTPIDRALFLLVMPPHTRVHILARADADTMFARNTSTAHHDRLGFELAQGDPSLGEMFDDAIGIRAIPCVYGVAAGVRSLVDDVTWELVAACVATLSQFAARRTPGLIYKPLMGGELTIRLTNYP